MAQRRADQIFSGVTPSTSENSQEVERADPGCAAAFSIDLAVRSASIHSAVSTARRRSRAASGPALRDRRTPPRQSGSPAPDRSRRARCRCCHRCRLRQFAQHHHVPAMAARTRSARAPGCRRSFPPVRRQEERQALVAADVLVGAGIFVAGMADQHEPATSSLNLPRQCRPKLPLRT